MHTITSHTTGMGNRCHEVKTDEREFAYCLYEQSLMLDIEPEITPCVGGFLIEFIASDDECFAAITEARRVAEGRPVTVPTGER